MLQKHAVIHTLHVIVLIIFSLCNNDGLDIECNSNNMTLYVRRDVDIYENDTIALTNAECTGVSNVTHFIISTGYENCNTSHRTVDDLIVFENTATIIRYVVDAPVQRKKHIDLTIKMKCDFPRSYLASANKINIEGDDDGYGAWSSYSPCTVTCGSGTRRRTRSCKLSNRCIGDLQNETIQCNTVACDLTSCAQVNCTKNFTRCLDRSAKALPPVCVCKERYAEVNGQCLTSNNTVEVKFFKLNITYKSAYDNLDAPVTQTFKKQLEKDLHAALNISSDEYVVVTNFTAGSVLVDFIVLLRDDSPDNKFTVEEKLTQEVRTNNTGYLWEYFPLAKQAIVVLDTNLCDLVRDSCNRTRSDCKPTPGIGLNYMCDCKDGYVQKNDYVCDIDDEGDKDNGDDQDTLKLTLIIVFVGLFILLFFIVCFILVSKRRRREKRKEQMREDVVDESGMTVHRDSIFEAFPRFGLGDRRMRAWSMYHDPPGLETTKYRDIPDIHFQR